MFERPVLRIATWIGLALAGCAFGAEVMPASEAPARPLRIVALGDSTTEAGWEGNANSVYAERLASALAARGVANEVINAGISDTTSRQAVARLDRDVRRHEPDYVIVQFGINDSWIDAHEGRTAPRLTLEEYADSLHTIIRTLRADGATVILMTPNPMRWSELYGGELRDPALGFDFGDPRGMNRLLDAYAERAREVARAEDVILVDVAERFEAYGRAPGRSVDDLLIENDGIHPNDAGHALIAEWLLEAILADRGGASAGAPRSAGGP
ncbi:MAG TPA: GDSL-type esterase/lipase family protein [Myxococcota bacterium]